MEPKLIPGGMVVDDRGWLSYINSMPFRKVKRIYMVGAHKQGFVRAWHGPPEGGQVRDGRKRYQSGWYSVC
jgi:hypothetical protein